MIKIRMKENNVYSLDGITTTNFLKGVEYDVPQVVFDYFFSVNHAEKINPTITEDKAVKAAPETKPRKIKEND